MKTLTKDELREAEAVLVKKYRGVVRGSLTNCATKGKYRGKRLVAVKCPHCAKTSKSTTQELFHLVCEHCGEPTQPKKRQKGGSHAK